MAGFPQCFQTITRRRDETIHSCETWGVRVWTNGDITRVIIGETQYRLAGGALSVEMDLEPQRGVRDEWADEVIAFSHLNGKRLDAMLAEQIKANVLDAVALDEVRVAAVIQKGRKHPRLVAGKVAGPYEVDLELTGEGTRVSWPKKLLWKKLPAVSRAKIFSGGTPRGIRVHASAHGIGVAASTSGHIGVVRPKEEELAFTLSIPGEEEARVDAIPTKEGVLVTITRKGKEGVVLHLSESGEVLGRWPEGITHGCFPASIVADDRVLVSDPAQDVLALLALPDLSEIQRIEMADEIVEAGVAPDGRHLALANRAHLYIGMVVGDRIVIDEPREIELARRPITTSTTPPSYVPATAIGEPQIVFPSIKRTPPAWKVKVGKKLDLDVLVRSGGGPGRGVRVAIEGAAVTEGLFEPVSVRCGDEEVTFSKKKPYAVLSEAWIPCGLSLPLNPPPKGDEEKEIAEQALAVTHLELVVRGRGKAAGSGLLTVVVGAEASPAAPLKWTRPLTVHK